MSDGFSGSPLIVFWWDQHEKFSTHLKWKLDRRKNDILVFTVRVRIDEMEKHHVMGIWTWPEAEKVAWENLELRPFIFYDIVLTTYYTFQGVELKLGSYTSIRIEKDWFL